MIFPHGDVYCEKYLSYLISNQQTLLLTLKIKHIPSALLIKSAKHRKGVKCVIMWGFHWGMCFYSQSGDKSFSFFFKSNWKHNAAVGWTHRSSSVSVITPNNVQSCQAPLSLSRCLSPLKPSQISFVWMCNYFVAWRKKKTIGILQFASSLEAASIRERGLCRQPALSPNIHKYTGTLLWVPPPLHANICGSPALQVTKDDLWGMRAQDKKTGLLYCEVTVCSALQQSIWSHYSESVFISSGLIIPLFI